MEKYKFVDHQQIKGHNSRTENVVKSWFELGLPFMIPDLVNKFKMICLRGTY